MTQMGLNYLVYQENRRNNLATEAETNRSNLARETETNRSNLAQEAETNRSNLARETETHRSNLAKEAETNRANLAREFETHRSNVMNEGLTRDKNEEYKRSNLVQEALKRESNKEQIRSNTMKALEGQKAQAGAQIKGIGVSGQTTAAANYATKTDPLLIQAAKTEAQRKAAAQRSAETERQLGAEGRRLIGASYSSQEDAIRAITSIPSEQRYNLQLTKTQQGWEIKQNPNIDPKTGKFKNWR